MHTLPDHGLLDFEGNNQVSGRPANRMIDPALATKYR
jgi:hypothetical protein